MNRWTYLTVFNNIRSAQQTSRVGGAGFRAGHLGQRTRRGEGAARQGGGVEWPEGDAERLVAAQP